MLHYEILQYFGGRFASTLVVLESQHVLAQAQKAIRAAGPRADAWLGQVCDDDGWQPSVQVLQLGGIANPLLALQQALGI